MAKVAPGRGPGRGGPTTSVQCEAWKQQLKAEKYNTELEANRSSANFGSLYVPNAYLSFYKTKGSNTHRELEFGIDKITQGLEFDERAPKDSQHNKYKRFHNGLQNMRPVISSQIYGWYRPIDQPKYGFARSQIVNTTFVDRSHVGPSRSASCGIQPQG